MFAKLFGGRKATRPRATRLGVDPLEQRMLLSVSPTLAPALVASQLPAVAVSTLRVDNSAPIAANAHDVVLAEMFALPLFGHGIVDTIDVSSAPGSDMQLHDATTQLMLRGDLNNNPRDGFEAFLGYAQYRGSDLATFHLSQPVFVGLGYTAKLQVTANMDDFLTGDRFGIQTDVSFVNVFGRRQNNVIEVGKPTIFDVVPAELGTLFITERQQATSDVAVANQKNVPLVRFEANASGADILATDFSFVAEQGNLNSANNYSLWVDTNSDGNVDTVLQNGVSASQGRVTFSSLANGGYVIPSSAFPTSFEVHADIASSPPSNTLQLNFAATDGVMAELAVNGHSLNADDIHLDASAESTVYTLVASGDLYVQQSTTPIRSQDLLGGTLADTVLRLTLHAEYEPVDVTRLSFSLSNTTALRSVDWLELYKPGSTTPFAIASVSQTLDGIGHFTARMNGHQLTIGKGEGQDVLVRPRMKSDEQGSVSGDTYAVSVARVEARGLASGNTLVQNDGDSVAEGEVIVGRSTAGPNLPIVGPVHTVVHSKIVSIVNANPDPNGTAIFSGVQPTGQFKLTTAAHNNTKNGSNDVVVDQLSFVVNATNVLLSTDDFALYDKANNILKQNGARFETLGGQPIVGSTITGTFRVVFDQISGRGVVNSAIDMGTNKTFVVQTTVLNPKIANTNSTLQVSLETDRIVWFDMDSSSQIERTGINYPDSIVHSTSYQS